MKKKLKDKKIKIVKRQSVKDKDGFPKDVWILIHEGTLWAYFRWLSGKEFFSAASVQHDEESLFIINWRGDIDTDMGIEYNGKFYDITRIDIFRDTKKMLRFLRSCQKIHINKINCYAFSFSINFCGFIILALFLSLRVFSDVLFKISPVSNATFIKISGEISGFIWQQRA